MLTPLLASELDDFGKRHLVAPIQAIANRSIAQSQHGVAVIRRAAVIRENVIRPDLRIRLFDITQLQTSAGQKRNIFQNHPCSRCRFATVQPTPEHGVDRSPIKRQRIFLMRWKMSGARSHTVIWPQSTVREKQIQFT